MGLFTQLCHEIGLRAVYLRVVKILRNEGVIQIPNKDVLKKRYFLVYFMIVAFISPGEFPKILFPV